MNTSPWAPYRPTPDAPWNLERAWTLRRRAGFRRDLGELERDVADGPGPAVDRVLAGECRNEGIPAEFASTADLLGDAAAGASDAAAAPGVVALPGVVHARPARRTAHAGVARPLRDQPAQGGRRRRDAAQNETFRRLGRGPFGDLLREMLRDPALLDWLDAPSNRKGKPNENLARELLELFTLGVGRYTEDDVKEAARALTGLSVVQGRFQVRPQDHDDGEKTILGKTARFDADSLADHLVVAARGGRPARLAALRDVPGRRRGRRHRPGASSPTGCVATACTSAARSRRSCGRSFSSPRGTSTPASPTRSALSSGRCGPWSSSTRRPARCCWPSGPRGSARSCSIRRTSADGREAGAGCRAARSWRGRISRRPSPPGRLELRRDPARPGRPRRPSGPRAGTRRAVWCSSASCSPAGGPTAARSTRSGNRPRRGRRREPERINRAVALLLAAPEAQLC